MELILFENDSGGATRALAHGVSAFLVDWEREGKECRQSGFDTEIRPGTLEDLRALCTLPQARTWCRVNALGPGSAAEIDAAVSAGAHGVLLPMAMGACEVERFLRLVDGRCRAGALIETIGAVAAAAEIAALGLDRAYFGLNDFAICRGDRSIFRAVLDGTVERTREAMPDILFGFGGLTAVDAGAPVPAQCLLEEMARLRCGFTFLRRSFRRDVESRDRGAVVAGITEAWGRCLARGEGRIRSDRSRLEGFLRALGT